MKKHFQAAILGCDDCQTVVTSLRKRKHNLCTPCYKKRWKADNPEKHKLSEQKYYEANKDAVKARSKASYSPEYDRKKHLRQKYGLTVEDYNQMFDSQGGKCAICGKHQSEDEKTFCVDHNHDTGAVRGLLCSKCNKALGGFGDSIEMLNRATKYLKDYTNE